MTMTKSRVREIAEEINGGPLSEAESTFLVSWYAWATFGYAAIYSHEQREIPMTTIDEQLMITVGHASGEYFTPWRFDELRKLVKLLSEQTNAMSFVLYYDEREDFHCLDFTDDGHEYTVRFYRIKALARKGETELRYFEYPGRNEDIVRFFTSGRCKLPWPGYATST